MPEEIRARAASSAESTDAARVTIRTESGEALVVGTSEIQSIAAKITTREGMIDQNKDALLDMAAEENIPVPSGALKEDVVDILVSRHSPLAVGEVLYEGTDQEIKGPGPEWQRTEGGEYVNR